MDEYMTIATYATTSEALVYKNKLEERGIDAFLSDNHAALEPITQANNSNVLLNIQKKDFELASKIIGTEV